MSENFLADVAAEIAAQPPKVKWRPNPRVLLHPQIPKPMHGLAPRVVLGRAWWDVERSAAFASTDNHCLACGAARYDDPAWPHLEGHEEYRINYRRGIMTYVRCVPLCHWCHSFVHAGRTETLFRIGKITRADFDKTMKRANAMLKKAKLKPRAPYLGPCAAWSAWRLVVNGEEHPPIWRDYAHWAAGHAKINEEG